MMSLFSKRSDYDSLPTLGFADANPPLHYTQEEPGLGLGENAPPQQPEESPPAAESGDEINDPLPDWLSKFRDFRDAMRGQIPWEDRVRNVRSLVKQREAEALQRSLVNMKDSQEALRSDMSLMGEMSPEDRQTYADTLEKKWESTQPGMGAVVKNITKHRLANMADVDRFIKIDPVARTRFQAEGVEGVIDELGKDEAGKRLSAYALEQIRPDVMKSAISAIDYIQKQYPDEWSDALKEDKGIQMDEMQYFNSKLPENLRLSDEHLIAIESDPQLQRSFGIEPSDIALTRNREYQKALDKAKIEADHRAPPGAVNVAVPGVGVRISYDRGKTIVINGRSVTPPEGSQVISSQAQGPLQDYIPGVAPSKRETEEAGAAARESSERITKMRQISERIGNASPAAVGALGGISELVSGTIGQFAPGVAGALSEAVTGMGPGELTNLRTTIKTIAPQSIQQFTGEETGRITDRELELTKRATRADSAAASKEQILGAIRALTMMDLLTRDRNLITAGLTPRFKVDTDEESTETAKALIYEYGLDAVDAGHTIQALRRQRELLAEAGAGKKK